VHARNAVLKGLSPKENREIPPLRYEVVYRLKQDFPELEIVLNGGITGPAQIAAHAGKVDGVMLGRAAYHDPWVLADGGRTRSEVVRAMLPYLEDRILKGENIRSVVRHMLGLYHGERRAKLWRRMLSGSALLAKNDPQLLLQALEAVENPRSMMLAA
jgi:tRNA-dihydrouridine synthase A